MPDKKYAATPLLIMIWVIAIFFLLFDLAQLINPPDFLVDGQQSWLINPPLLAFICIIVLLITYLNCGYSGLARLFSMSGACASLLYPLLILYEIRLSWWFCLAAFFALWFFTAIGLWFFDTRRHKMLAAWFVGAGGTILYLYLDRTFYLYFKTHLNLMHIWRLRHTAVQDANLNIDNLSPYFLEIAAFLLFSILFFLIKRDFSKVLQRKRMIGAMTVQFIVLIFHFNFIVDSRPFSEYLLFRIAAAGINVPLPSALKPLEEAGLVTSSFKLDPDSFYQPPDFSWSGSSQKNLIFLTLESVRAHDIANTMPLLKKWSEKGIFFHRHFSASNLTEAALTSIYFGTYPFFLTRSLRQNLSWPLTDFLKESGYNLFKVYSKWTGIDTRYNGFSMIAIPPPTPDDPETSEQPFEWFINISDQKLQRMAQSSGEILDKVLEISKSQKKFFIEGYLFNTHFNYTYPEEFAINQPTLPERFLIYHLDQSPQNLTMLRNRYKNSLAYVDHCLDRFLTEIYQSEMKENTIVVIYGDHGQSLGEVGFMAHASGPHIYQFHVPLLIIGSGVASQQFNGLSQHPDIVPTLGAIMGFDCRNAFGKNLFKEHRTVTIEQENSVLDRIIVRRPTGMSLYDVTSENRLRWVITIGNHFEMHPDLLKAYSEPGLNGLKQIIADDMLQIKKECRITF